MKIANRTYYTIFCIHNNVINRIDDISSSEFIVAQICALLNQSKISCVDYLYIETVHIPNKIKSYYEINDKCPEDTLFLNKLSKGEYNEI